LFIAAFNVGRVIAATTPIIPRVINTSARVKPLFSKKFLLKKETTFSIT